MKTTNETETLWSLDEAITTALELQAECDDELEYIVETRGEYGAIHVHDLDGSYIWTL